MDFAKFGTPGFELRPSRLGKMLVCPWRVALVTMGDEDKAGAAADTGSATHKAVAIWHRGGDHAAAVRGMGEARAEYPLADLQTAAALFLAYAADPRSASPELALLEQQLSWTIPAAEDDPTGAPIAMLGTPDQVRRENGALRLWDLKTSSRMPAEVLWDSTLQAAAYCLGAEQALGEPVHPGGVIMPKRSPMYIPFVWGRDDVLRILQPVRDVVALVRRGKVWHNPTGDGCKWCHTGGPDDCLPRLRIELPII